MRRTTLVTCAAAASASCAFITGCAAEPATTATTHSPAVRSAVFATADEALDAAVDTYSRYIEIGSTISGGGGHDTSSLAGVETGDALQSDLDLYDTVRTLRVHSVGSTRFESATHISNTLDDTGVAHVLIRLCSDSTGVRVVDEAGADVTRPDRQDRITLDVSFVGTAPGSSQLLIDSSSLVTDSTAC